MLCDGSDEGGEIAWVTESAASDGIKDLCELGVELEITVQVSVAELFNVLCKVSE